MNNFEKIKSMSKEQMTHFMLDIMLDTLNNNVCGYCENCDVPCLKNEKTIKNCSRARLKNDIKRSFAKSNQYIWCGKSDDKDGRRVV